MSSPANPAGAAEVVRAGYESREAIYPLGGHTSLDYGILPTKTGRGLDLTGLSRIVDYTPRDMTIVVEAGVRMASLAKVIAVEGQQLPIDVPRADEATIGGAVATDWCGPRRYGYGTLRDYVIGIHAVDGRGVAFKGGGRVVKNVAGYDFCKLLTGSLGTLAVITQLALKLKPLAEQSSTIVASCLDWDTAESLLERLNVLAAPPAAIDVIAGNGWADIVGAGLDTPGEFKPVAAIVARLEGTAVEVAALAEDVQYQMWSSGCGEVRVLPEVDSESLWRRQIEFADRGPGDIPDNATLVLRIAVRPSAVTTVLADIQRLKTACTIHSHAGNGIVVARFADVDLTAANGLLLSRLRPSLARLGGSAVVVSTSLDGLTPHMIWGGRDAATALMERIKRQFDPQNILNPGRFVY
jgi:glycolate oxidase FAD binding subunit